MFINCIPKFETEINTYRYVKLNSNGEIVLPNIIDKENKSVEV